MTDWQRRSEELERDLRELAAAMAHDLRAPLRAVDGFSRALAGELAGRLEGNGERYLGLVRDSARQTGKLIEGMVALARLSVAPLQPQAVELRALAGPVLADLAAGDPGRPVEVEVADALPVQGDPPLLQVLLESLLSNAWKFTGAAAPARIQLGARQEPGRLVYFVADNGVGFDPARSERLFQPFCRLHPAAEYPGLGLGLARARRAVSRHGGAIWATGAPGAGATFSFTLAPG